MKETVWENVSTDHRRVNVSTDHRQANEWADQHKLLATTVAQETTAVQEAILAQETTVVRKVPTPQR